MGKREIGEMTKKPENDDYPDSIKADQLDMFHIEPVQKQQIRKRINSASKSQKIINRLKSQLETFRFVETIKANKIKITMIEISNYVKIIDTHVYFQFTKTCT